MTPIRIKRAAEMADHFGVDDAGVAVFYYWPCNPADNDFPQWWLDALAAELVRLIDELAPEGIVIVRKPGETIITDLSSGNRVAGQAYGPDRTENDINAIVESELLK